MRTPSRTPSVDGLDWFSSANRPIDHVWQVRAELDQAEQLSAQRATQLRDADGRLGAARAREAALGVTRATLLAELRTHDELVVPQLAAQMHEVADMQVVMPPPSPLLLPSPPHRATPISM